MLLLSVGLFHHISQIHVDDKTVLLFVLFMKISEKLIVQLHD